VTGKHILRANLTKMVISIGSWGIGGAIGKNMLKEQSSRTGHHSNQLWHPQCLEEFYQQKGQSLHNYHVG
jgi:hypothetical protein